MNGPKPPKYRSSYEVIAQGMEHKSDHADGRWSGRLPPRHLLCSHLLCQGTRSNVARNPNVSHSWSVWFVMLPDALLFPAETDAFAY